MNDLRQQLYNVKMVLFAVTLAIIGFGLLVLARHAAEDPNLAWLRFWPLGEIGSTLFVTGLVVVGLDWWDGRDKEARDTERLRRVLRSEAPAMREAVINGFAAAPDDLARVATPELLDRLATNSMALRLGDTDFAREIYDDIRDQAVHAAERWHDVQVAARLTMVRGSSEARTPLFDVTVKWECTLVPKHPTRRFACVSNRDEYRELKQDLGATSAWFMKPKPGVDAGAREAFELVQFTVDGAERPIRRTTRKGGQTYSVDVGRGVIEAGEPVVVSWTYRTVTAQDGHLLYFDIEQPTRGIEIELDYTDCGIDYVNALDFFPNSAKTRVQRTPASVPEQAVAVAFDGWVFPKAGVAFVWARTGLEQGETRTAA